MARFFWILLLFLATATPTLAQFGLSGHYLHYAHDEFALLPDETLEGPVVQLPGSGWSAGLNYWFRLRNLRIEFIPEVSYGQTQQILPDNNTFDAQWLAFTVHTQFYLLDLFSDCDCPTFSKQNDLFQRGFFLSLSPGLTYATFDTGSQLIGPLDRSQTGLVPHLGAGIGMDIGLNDFITLTPYAGARYLFSFDGPRQINYAADAARPLYHLQASDINLWQLQAGLRFSLRFDYR